MKYLGKFVDASFDNDLPSLGDLIKEGIVDVSVSN